MTKETTENLLETLDLTEYEIKTLEKLLTLGRTTAPDLSEATGIPKARIYGVLESLSDQGYIKIIPGRPKVYQPKKPERILDRAIENQRQRYESFQKQIKEIKPEFLEKFQSLYEQASEDITPTEELFYVVDVGEESERETRQLYHNAKENIYVLTKSFGFFDSVKPAVEDALERETKINVLLLHPDHIESENKDRQAEIVRQIHRDYPDINLRYSDEYLPWRGTFIDPSMEYDSGKAILLVDEENVPNYMRQAAITEHGSFVAGLKRYFDLIWGYDSTPA